MSTRPRISFDDRGRCNACRWMEAKKDLDWNERETELKALLSSVRCDDGRFDCLVPVSGGKDGSYVAYNLKHKYNMNPLAITVTPAMPLQLGEQNLKAFVDSGYNHITVNPAYEAMRVLNKTGFVEMGFPYYGWLISIVTVPVQFALQYGIELIFYGEDGEVEYGGTKETAKNPIYDVAYQKKVYLERGYEKVLKQSGLSPQEIHFFKYPEDDLIKAGNIKLTHWSYFENWDPYRNYVVAKEYCGLKEAIGSNEGTFTNFAQNDQALYALHTYMMYLKYGFGRANQDACIEVRRGSMDRQQAVNLVRLYDGLYPENYIDRYLTYFDMSMAEFDSVLDRWVNKDLFEYLDGHWKAKFTIQ